MCGVYFDSFDGGAVVVSARICVLVLMLQYRQYRINQLSLHPDSTPLHSTLLTVVYALNVASGTKYCCVSVHKRLFINAGSCH